MKKIELQTQCKKMLADVFTPVGIYLRVRDRFRDTVLLESTDHHAAENSYSFIGINAIAGIEISSNKSIEFNSNVIHGELPKSALFVPLISGNEIKGMISLQNLDKENHA